MAKPSTTREAVIPLLTEAFREHGYEGASMAILQDATSLGRGSLYHFFPGGKEEMAAAVLADIQAWFDERIFTPLRATSTNAEEARQGIHAMIDEVRAYFRSGRRACLPGAFATGRERDQFDEAVRGYFTEWVDSLTAALAAAGSPEPRSHALQLVAAIQGGIVLARALDDPDAFDTVLDAASPARRR
ncbi:MULTISPECIES: TetR/AcrR family transcriptional regulator [unclassified Pseudoclavibacter]|uniref:TetR/AcrR family transcriptional regulator n=1 Tax=unclassified Pseudoclavibacter TaxID=2615177 RepID=UPI000CE8EA1F|nr:MULTISPECIES: TetR/AcrR family transcriptional regulator [unclassified Pseudoclavibacter]MBF4550716.1 TetR/AcrR family transcriptional regulator [Pseudoclavibacter sp. VKM Ac-2888]PPF34640.1 TetR family transcriptional regulator [Pseudoclavibacter sp. AY1H1]